MTIDCRVIILAGGQGSRFWPVSRQKRPKQFFSISPNGESLIQATARRLQPLVRPGNITVVTNIIHRPLVEEHVPTAKVLCEPIGRNTAPSIGLAALYVRRENPEAVLVTVPADHAVKNEEVLRSTLQKAIELARSGDWLVTVGIKPTEPHTGYGYIRCGKAIPKTAGGFAVSRFFEKPNVERARRYVEAGDFLWNSGMFVWRADAILKSIQEFMPGLYDGLMRIDAAIGTKREQPVLAEVFDQLEPNSIDFGILEHARNCAVIAAEPFGWSDVGSWDQWAEHFVPDAQGNLIRGEAVIVDSSDCIVQSDRAAIAVIGMHDLIVIDTGDAILVCPRNRVQDVRAVVSELQRRGRTELT